MNILGLLLISILIIALSLMPGSVIESRNIINFKGMDKIVHFLMYAFLMFVWLKSMNHKRSVKVKNYYIATGFIYCIVLGLILEILQDKMAIGRSFEIWDIFANIAGALTVILFFKNKNS